MSWTRDIVILAVAWYLWGWVCALGIGLAWCVWGLLDVAYLLFKWYATQDLDTRDMGELWDKARRIS